jgi:CheY-like chemotaxis protein
LILLDLMMPEMDGFEFLAELRRHPEWNSIPVLVITAKQLTPQERAVLNERVTQILEKGAYHKDELLDAVRDMVAAHGAQAAAR